MQASCTPSTGPLSLPLPWDPAHALQQAPDQPEDKHIPCLSTCAVNPGIVKQLMDGCQHQRDADDAGASEVAFMLDENSYPTDSILGMLLSCQAKP